MLTGYLGNQIIFLYLDENGDIVDLH